MPSHAGRRAVSKSRSPFLMTATSRGPSGSVAASLSGLSAEAASFDGRWSGQTGNDPRGTVCNTAYISVTVKGARIVEGNVQSPRGSGDISPAPMNANGSAEISMSTGQFRGKLRFVDDQLAGTVQTTCAPGARLPVYVKAGDPACAPCAATCRNSRAEGRSPFRGASGPPRAERRSGALRMPVRASRDSGVCRSIEPETVYCGAGVRHPTHTLSRGAARSKPLATERAL
jgi:hypothetical protein